MNSIANSIDGVSIANQIRLERAHHAGSFLLVEGSGDAKVFRGFCDQEECSIVVCLGKDKLVEEIGELEASRFAGALGFMDRDFGEFIGYPNVIGDVVYSDENDMEMAILCSTALDKILREFGNGDAISRSVCVSGKSIRETIFSSASVVGALRLVAQEHQLPLRFDGMKYKFKRRNSCIIDEKLTVQHIFGRSRGRGGVNEDDLLSAVRGHLSGDKDLKLLCSGHDCVRVLGRALKKEFGNSDHFDSDEGAKMLEGVLRISYDLRDFQSTGAYSRMCNWEVDRGFTIFGVSSQNAGTKIP